ncbi:MAG: PIN domain-containing protein [Patescibacteria group bacterium]
MNKRYIVDTNIILRFLLQDIALQYNQAKKIFADAKNGKIKLIIPQIVIFEINFALKKYYRLEKEDIIEKIEPILSTEYIEVESRELFFMAIGLHRRENISFVDCFLLSKAKVEEAELFTFDEKLGKLK